MAKGKNKRAAMAVRIRDMVEEGNDTVVADARALRAQNRRSKRDIRRQLVDEEVDDETGQPHEPRNDAIIQPPEPRNDETGQEQDQEDNQPSESQASQHIGRVI